MKKFISISMVLAMVAMSGCDGCGKKKIDSVPADIQASAFIPDFDADSAYFFVEKQVLFGPRVPGTKAHSECAQWLTEKLKEYTPNVIVQDFQARSYNNIILSGKNIIAEFEPEKKSRILLCAHWDSRPYADHDPDPANYQKPIDGANDGASGVAVLLEIARHLSKNQTSPGIDIIFFDLEDYGEPNGIQSEKEDNWALGSQYWAKNPHKTSYSARFGILLDMVGAADASFSMEGTSMYYAPDVMKKVWQTAENLGYKQYFSTQRTGSITDDHLYINKFIGIPTIDIIHYESGFRSGFFKHWHTVNDNLSVIDKNTLRVVGHTVLTVIFQEP